MLLSLGSKRTGAIACAAVVSVGMATFVTRGTSSQHYLERADLERIASINREIARYVVTQGGRATVSFDRVVDYLNQSTIRIEAFERFQEDIAIVPAFGAGQYGIFPTPRDVALALIAKSDVIVLTDSDDGPVAPLPDEHQDPGILGGAVGMDQGASRAYLFDADCGYTVPGFRETAGRGRRSVSGMDHERRHLDHRRREPICALAFDRAEG